MRLTRIISTLVLFMLAAFGLQANRTRYTINESWYFISDNEPTMADPLFADQAYPIVSIPHTWNDLDVADEAPGYDRDVKWYRKKMHIDTALEGKKLYLYFEGANQVLTLYVNGSKVGEHVGGYTRFCYDITPYVTYGVENQIALQVDNRFNPAIPPLTADFTFFGGIYRDIYFEIVDPIQISKTHHASTGVYISTPNVSEKEAELAIETLLSNYTDKAQQVVLEQKLLAADGSIVKVDTKKVKLPAGSENVSVKQNFTAANPQLWSPDSPTLYRVETSLLTTTKDKTTIDKVNNTIGFRWYSFDVEEGFKLNGEPLKLIGTNRHQCYFEKGNALTDQMHVRDVLLLKEMGGNFLRVSHYPQDPVVMEMCDKLGIITSVEIPIINYITMSEDFAQNCLSMATEMVHQDFNRASVVIWAYMNEVLLRFPYDEKEVDVVEYTKVVTALAERIEAQIRQDDPYRYTMIPNHGSFDKYKDARLTEIPMINGWNLYNGWYGSTFEGLDKFIERAKNEQPDRPFILTEYGADIDPCLHSYNPLRFDFTTDYGNKYHEYYLKTIINTSWVVGANVWNLNDFYSETRGDAVPHVNNKGLTGTDREIKDAYKIYVANLTDEPYVSIEKHEWNYRSAAANDGDAFKVPVTVYANGDNVELIHNGTSVGKAAIEKGKAMFTVSYVDGENTLEAIRTAADGSEAKDFQRIQFTVIPQQLATYTDFVDMNVMLGCYRYYEERESRVTWIPEQAYTEGSWGYVGGKTYQRDGKIPASNLDILGSEIDPVFQTSREGIEQFKADVPDGDYSVYLYWAELVQKEKREALAYEIGMGNGEDSKYSERVFSVSVNGDKLLKDINLAEQYGEARAVIKKIDVEVRDGKGITIDFDATAGATTLNAIRIYKNY